MPDQSGVQPLQFSCAGGLVLNQSAFAMQPGMAQELVNFEPDINGGYRRINGFDKWNSNVVPFTTSDTEKVLMVASFGSTDVLAARGEKVFVADESSSWTAIETGRTGAGKYDFKRYNFTGTDKIIYTDGANKPSIYDGTSATQITCSFCPDDPSIVEVFKNHVFLAGDSTTPEEVYFSSPYDEDNYNPANGAGSIRIDDEVVQLKKTQYRIFFVNADDTEPNTKGVLTSLTQQGFEFADLRGIRPSCCDSDVAKNPEIVIHGGFDGHVYQQEVGNDFDGSAINGKYRSPDLTMGDAGIRKIMQRVILNFAPEAAISADMFLRYDYESPSTPRPAAYPLDSSQVLAIYGVSTYGTATYGGQRQPLFRQPVEGSGFAVAIRVNDDGVSAPYSLKGFQLEFGVGARR